MRTHRRAMLALATAVVLAAGRVSAQEPARIDAPLPAGTVSASPARDAAISPHAGTRLFDPWIDVPRASHVVPALEIVGFDALLNRYDNRFEGSEYHVTLDSVRRNLRHRWVADNDPFEINQFLHPYQGSIYHGFARSAGLGYWESALYTFAGSAFWEITGETTPPSRNDQIASGVAGSFLGEALFRVASLVLEQDDLPPFWREVAAAAVSPSTGFNRLAFGERFKPVFDSHDPARYTRMSIGASATTQNLPGTSTRVRRNEALATYAIDYGLPGKAGYTYTRPFDYFSFQATATSGGSGFEEIVTRGLLVGTDYGVGERVRGLWGLYGSYDYLAPQLFRVSSTALSLGTTAQWWLTEGVALQGTGLLGTGYTGVGTLRGTDERDYHYGLAPQALLALRMIVGRTASLDVSGREYFVSRVGGAGGGGRDNIVRGDASLTVRVSGPHAVSLRYLWTRRDASYSTLSDQTQSRGTIGVFYTLLGHDRFGAVEWR